MNYKWWSDNKASTLKKTGLGKALQAYGKADRAADKRCKVEALRAKYDSLQDVKAAANKGIGLCIPKVHAETKSALKTYDGVVKSVAVPLKAQIVSVEKEIDTWKTLNKTRLPKINAAGKNLEKCIVKMTEIEQVAKKLTDASKAAQLTKLSDKFFDLGERQYQIIYSAMEDFKALMKKSSENILFGHGQDVVMEYMKPISNARQFEQERRDKLKKLAANVKEAVAKVK